MVPISDDPRRFQPGSRLQWSDRELTVEGSRPHGNRLLVKFEGVDTRNDAEGLRGPLFVPVDEARTLEEDEFWPHDLVGTRVETSDGTPRGTVREVTPGVAHDLLVVDTERGERLVPLVRDIVVDVDVESGVIVVAPPEGLLD